jgi:hypothetical protein
MREKQPYLVNSTESQIAFDPFEFGIIDGRFDIAILNHGDGESFKWIAGGGEFTYRIQKLSENPAISDGTSATCWEFTQTDSDGNEELAYIDVPRHEVLDISGEPASFRLINDVSNAVIDIQWELDELNIGVRAIFAKDKNGNEFLLPRYSQE